MEKIRHIFDKVEDFVINICAVFLVAIIVVIMYQVIARRLDIATSGTEELARYCYVLFVFLLWPIAAKRGQDLRITVIFDLFSVRVREIIMGVFQIFMAGFSGVCVYSIYLNIQNAVKNNTVLPSNTWVPLSAVFILILVALVLTLLANLLRAALLFMGQEHVRTQQEENEAEMMAESAKIAEELKKGGAEV
ncbi:TRAP transporter small permease [Oscillibacter sp.]|uniref:TRAP transporter small permease n=1 Tax=Oscillibacter sp. TaxID=1945593 RepID=UPI002633182A|nr:TRAP transporter small permease subunit [Oscillibacter sp.]MDD3347894.1 TRAP transporter small permease subunit [Oscillibacter sp.]